MVFIYNRVRRARRWAKLPRKCGVPRGMGGGGRKIKALKTNLRYGSYGTVEIPASQRYNVYTRMLISRNRSPFKVRSIRQHLLSLSRLVLSSFSDSSTIIRFFYPRLVFLLTFYAGIDWRKGKKKALNRYRCFLQLRENV